MAISKQRLLAIQAREEQTFIHSKIAEFDEAFIKAASEMKRTLEIEYHPLLDSYYSDLKTNGLQYVDRGLNTITFSWYI